MSESRYFDSELGIWVKGETKVYHACNGTGWSGYDWGGPCPYGCPYPTLQTVKKQSAKKKRVVKNKYKGE